jgi:ABC-type branched-subunit amino acid transport system substrate-binding protein
MPSLSARLVFACLAVAFLTSCGTEVRPDESAKKQDHTLKIYYLWTTDGDPHQHSYLKAGVESAYQLQDMKLLLGDVAVVPLLDPVTKNEAIALAQKLRSSPDTLAVIGNQYSGTTWVTLPIFADAGIPVMVPGATSPYLFFEHRETDEPNLDLARTGELDEERCEEPDCYFVRPGTNQSVDRFHNAFRLVPADVPDQVSAIQLTIRKLRELKEGSSAEPTKRPDEPPPTVMLICDQTTHNNAGVYSRPMCDYLQRFTSHRDLIAGRQMQPDYRIVSSRNFNLDHGDLMGLVTAIRAATPDYIVLVGYNELAWPILQALKERDDLDPKMRDDLDPKTKKHKRKRTFIMSDGAFSDNTPEKLSQFADIYFTYFSHPHHEQDKCHEKTKGRDEVRVVAEDKGATPRKAEQPVAETAEAFAYDAVLILARGVKHCNDHLDRACLLDFLTRQQNLTGRYEHYDFHLGERQHAAYYVYAEGQRQKGATLQPKWYATSEDDGLRPYVDGCTGPTTSWE